MTDRRDQPEMVVPIVEEQVRVGVRERPTGRVRISTTVHSRVEHVERDLVHKDVHVERVVIDRPIDTVPDVRTEGDVMIYPVVDEVLVVTKQLILREEIRITEVRRTEHFSEDVTLRRTEAKVERLPIKEG
jgi:stress response protein YsnF